MNRDNTKLFDSPHAVFRAQYPFATAPDIIRSNQKDTYFQTVLVENLSSVLRSVYGARFIHRYASETKASSDLLYFLCTTLIGNRTLGEEYCDIVQVESSTLRSPSTLRRSGYILSSIVLPYTLNRVLPKLRLAIAGILQANYQPSNYMEFQASTMNRMCIYMTRNLSALTSSAPIHAVGLAVFYFSGAYYHLSKRVWGLRYLFSKRIEPSDQRIGYEVLGILLILQLSAQVWLHLQDTYNLDVPLVMNPTALVNGTALTPGGVELSIRSSHTTDVPLEARKSTTESHNIAEGHMATSFSDQPRYSLDEPNVLAWIDGRQQRKCTLCLEELKDPGITTCGHVFCWSCILDWIKEKPECPLCRQYILAQHVLPLRD